VKSFVEKPARQIMLISNGGFYRPIPQRLTGTRAEHDRLGTGHRSRASQKMTACAYQHQRFWQPMDTLSENACSTSYGSRVAHPGDRGRRRMAATLRFCRYCWKHHASGAGRSRMTPISNASFAPIMHSLVSVSTR